MRKSTVIAVSVVISVARAAMAAEQSAVVTTTSQTATTSKAATPSATPAVKTEAVPGTGGAMQAAPGALQAPPGAITVIKPETQATTTSPAATTAPAGAKPQEHPGHEHPGQEHPGGKAKMDGQSVLFTAPQIKAAMQEYVNTQTAKGNGTFRIHDPVDRKDLNLRLVKIHDPVRQVAGKGYFACADFQTTNGPTVYDLDVWLNPRDGTLTPSETVVHKVNGQARFTYRNDEAVPVQ